MKISAIKYYNNINNSYFSGLYINKPSNGNIELGFQSPTLENLSDYEFAEKYYNKNWMKMGNFLIMRKVS